MAIYRMLLDDFETVDFQLIAILSSLEDYRMAYFLNQSLSIFLEKNKEKIVVNSKFGNAFYSKFIFEDLKKDMVWHLVQNKNEIISISNNQVQNLFFDKEIETETKVFLLPEFKNVDYILKIDNSDHNLNFDQIIKKINTIDNVTTVYEINQNALKSKNNLIF